MEIIQNVLSEEEFNQELINRFFNSNSYFFLCVRDEIERLLEDEHEPNRKEYLLFANLIDKLVGNENKHSMLISLSKINGFDKFHDKLTAGAKYLREAALDCESMKIEIKKLAQSLTKIALKAVLTYESKVELERYLNDFHSPVNEETTQEIENEGDALNLNDIFKEQETQFEPNYKNNLEIDSSEPSSEVTGKAESKLFLESTNSASEIEEEKEILQNTYEGKDALVEGGCELSLTEEGGSDEFTFLNRADGNALNDEPLSLIEDFQNEIKDKVEQIQKAIELLTENYKDKKQWHACEFLFENLAAKAMVYGFDAVEQIALKARKFIEIVLSELETYSDSVILLLSETRSVLSSLITSHVDEIDDAVIKKLFKQLMNPKEAVEELLSFAEKNSVDYSTTGGDTNFNSNNEIHDAGEVTIADLNDNVFRTNMKSKDVNFKLPGEDDEEILNLVEEISGENSKEEVKVIESDNSITSEAIESAALLEETPEFHNNSSDLAKVVTPLSKEQFEQFNKEAEFFYNIIEEALTRLHIEPFEKAALEDLELASNSLCGLTQKLNLDFLSKFPASVEEYIGNLISTKSSLSENGQQLIKEVYQRFRNLKCVEDTESHKCNELLAMLQKLNSTVQKKTNDYSQLHDNDLLVSKKEYKSRLHTF